MYKVILKTYIIYFFIFIIVSCTCSINATLHDEDKAAIVAERFFNTLVKDKKVDDAYVQAGQMLRDSATKTQLVELLQYIENEGAPSGVKPVAYENFGSKEEMNIYLANEENLTKTRYQIGLHGTMLKGYEVVGLFLVNDEYKPVGNYKEF